MQLLLNTLATVSYLFDVAQWSDLCKKFLSLGTKNIAICIDDELTLQNHDNYGSKNMEKTNPTGQENYSFFQPTDGNFPQFFWIAVCLSFVIKS